MLTFLVPVVEGLLGPNLAKYAKPLIFAVLGLLILLALWGGKCAYDKSVVTKYQEKQEQRAAPATTQADAERNTETTIIATHDQEMHHAIAEAPDQPIAPTSRVHGCDQLRRAHRSVAACRGPSSGH